MSLLQERSQPGCSKLSHFQLTRLVSKTCSISVTLRKQLRNTCWIGFLPIRLAVYLYKLQAEDHHLQTQRKHPISNQTVQLYVWPLFPAREPRLREPQLLSSKGSISRRSKQPQPITPGETGFSCSILYPPSGSSRAASAVLLRTREDVQGNPCFPRDLGKASFGRCFKWPSLFTLTKKENPVYFCSGCIAVAMYQHGRN